MSTLPTFSSSKMHYLSHLARTGAEFIHPGGRRASELMLDMLEISEGMSILEIGCGPAATLEMICERWHVHAIGLDYLPEMLVAARRRQYSGRHGCGPGFIIGRSENLPFCDAAFDRVYSESVIAVQSTPDIRRTLSEVARVLKPGGRFVANDGIWTPGVDAETVRSINEACLSRFGLRQSTDEPWTAANWVDELTRSGLVVESSELLGEEAPVAANGLARIRKGIRKLWSLGTPGLALEFLLYRKKLQRMRRNSQLLEGRIFVARREQ
jgi:SAM-dependent methyltransferase